MNEIKNPEKIKLTQEVKVFIHYDNIEKIFLYMNKLNFKFDINCKEKESFKGSIYMFFSPNKIFGIFDHKDLFDLCSWKEIDFNYLIEQL